MVVCPSEATLRKPLMTPLLPPPTSLAVTMSLPAILGSAIIAFGMIPSICSIAVGDMKLSTWAVMRDSVIYVVAVALMWNFLEDGVVDLRESFILTALYFAYLVIIFVPVCCSKATVDYTNIADAEGSVEEEEDEDEGGSNFVVSILSKFYQLIFAWTVPVQPEGSPNNSTCKAFISVLLALLWVTALSSAALVRR